MCGPRERRARLRGLFVAVGAIACAHTASAASVRWRGDFEAAVSAARQRRVPVMVWVAYDRCSLCLQLDGRTFSSPRIVELSTLFECVRDEGSGRGTAGAGGDSEPLVQAYKVIVHPTVLFLDPDGATEMYRVEGAGHPASKFEGIMADMLELYAAQKAIEADGADVGALFTLGHIQVGLERYEKARPPLRAALAADSDDRLGHREDVTLDLAICTLQLDRPEPKATSSAGIRALQAFLDAYPNSRRRGEALFFLASGWLQLTNQEEARKCLQEVLESEPETSQWHQMAARLLRPLEMQELQRYILEHPDDAEAYFRLGHMATLEGQYAVGPRFLSRYLALDRDDKFGHLEDAWLDMGICDVNRVQTGKGIMRLRRFLQQYPGSRRLPEALYHLGCAYKVIGNTAEAKAMFERLIREFPESPLAPNAAQLLRQTR